MKTTHYAREIVLSELLKNYKVKDDTLIIFDDQTVEKPYGWVFFYGSKNFSETDDIEYALAGNGPVVFLKDSNEIIRLGTALLPEMEIENFERIRGFR